MVEIAKWGKINQSKFWDFAGLSLFNLSIGISIGIARADNFILSSNSGQLAVAKAAIQLNSNAEELKKVANKINPKGTSQKKDLNEISSDISDTQKNLNKIVEEEF